MTGAHQFVTSDSGKRALNSAAAILIFALAIPAIAQTHGPQTTTTVNGHFLAPAPSVTSIGSGRHLPPPLPSVTSIPNMPAGNGFHNRGRFNNHFDGRGGFAYSVPYYYYPLDDPSAYGYDYVGGGSPDLYSGPPLGPDQNPHIVVEQPPARPYRDDYAPYPQAYAPVPRPMPNDPPPATPAVEVNPGDPTVLIFRDGHQQEVTNYAIMGDSVYVFDKGKKKVALADLDLTATVKANDDRGLEFKVPASPKKNTAAPQAVTPPPAAAPDPNASAPSKIASAMP